MPSVAAHLFAEGVRRKKLIVLPRLLSPGSTARAGSAFAQDRTEEYHNFEEKETSKLLLNRSQLSEIRLFVHSDRLLLLTRLVPMKQIGR